MAVTIEASPGQVWPWLVQMGWDRGGWYSWDRLDNAGRPSATEVHPEWQDVAVLDHTSHVLRTRMTAALAEIGMTPRMHCVLVKAIEAERTQAQLVVDRVHREAIDSLPEAARSALIDALSLLAAGHLSMPDDTSRGVRRARQQA